MASIKGRTEGDFGGEGVSVNLISSVEVALGGVSIIVRFRALVVSVDVQLQLGRSEGLTFHAANLGIKLVIRISCLLKHDALVTGKVIEVRHTHIASLMSTKSKQGVNSR